MADKQVANLIGGVEFRVNTTPLEQLFAHLKKTELKLRQFGRLAEKPIKIAIQLDTKALDKQMRDLEAKIRKSIGITAPGAPAPQNTKTLDRVVAQQLRLEKLTQQARRSTFQAELAQSKLSFANQREDVALSTAKTRQLQQQAVLQAKLALASRQEINTQAASAKYQAQLTAAKTIQARLEQMLVAAQQKAAQAAAKTYQQQTLLQRAQLALDSQKQAERRREVNHANKMQDRRERAARAESGQERQRERFRFAQERHTVWQAKQAELAARKAEGGNGGFSMLGALGRSGLPMAGLAAGGLVAGIQQLLSMAGQRIEQRQQGADDAQQFKNVLAAAASQDQGKEGYIQQRFVDFSQKYGTEISLDTAKDYRNGLLKQRGQGRSLEQAMQLYETQAAAFRGAGMTQDESRRANLQLTQVRTKGYADREDLNTFSEAAPILRGYIERAWAERNKFTGDPAKRQAAVIDSTTKGNLKAADFNRALELYFAENQKVIETQAKSIQANAQRLQNDQFLQAASINDNEKLVQSVNSNIEAHRNLTAAMEPLRTRVMEFDTALTSVAATMTQRIADALDPKKSTPEGMANAPDAGLGGNGGIDPAAFNKPKETGEVAVDPVDRFWQRLFGIVPQSVKDQQLGKSPIDQNALSYLAPTNSGDYKFGFDPKKLKTMVEGMNGASTTAEKQLQNITSSTNNTVTVAGSTFNLAFPNVETFDKSVVEQTVRDIGEAQRRQYEADILARLTTDKTPR
ncbi:tape measure protein [Pseudomonas sp. Marseille-Q7302]